MLLSKNLICLSSCAVIEMGSVGWEITRLICCSATPSAPCLLSSKVTCNNKSPSYISVQPESKIDVSQCLAHIIRFVWNMSAKKYMMHFRNCIHAMKPEMKEVNYLFPSFYIIYICFWRSIRCHHLVSLASNKIYRCRHALFWKKEVLFSIKKTLESLTIYTLACAFGN